MYRGSMNNGIKKKVMDWINEKTGSGNTCFEVSSCMQYIGLDPFSEEDYACVEEVFNWHQSMINHIYDVCFEENT